jgi:hypothetical protein
MCTSLSIFYFKKVRGKKEVSSDRATVFYFGAVT